MIYLTGGLSLSSQRVSGCKHPAFFNLTSTAIMAGKLVAAVWPSGKRRIAQHAWNGHQSLRQQLLRLVTVPLFLLKNKMKATCKRPTMKQPNQKLMPKISPTIWAQLYDAAPKGLSLK
jgi:hypothetical protein